MCLSSAHNMIIAQLKIRRIFFFDAKIPISKLYQHRALWRSADSVFSSSCFIFDRNQASEMILIAISISQTNKHTQTHSIWVRRRQQYRDDGLHKIYQFHLQIFPHKSFGKKNIQIFVPPSHDSTTEIKSKWTELFDYSWAEWHNFCVKIIKNCGLRWDAVGANNK